MVYGFSIKQNVFLNDFTSTTESNQNVKTLTENDNKAASDKTNQRIFKIFNRQKSIQQYQ
jgi:hypothetical protein